MKIKNENDEIKKKEKMLIQENKQKLDDLERTVKMIVNYKTSALFVHSVLGVPFSLSNSNLDNENKNDLKFSDKDGKENIETLSARLIADFPSDEDVDDIYPDFLCETNRIINKFSELEDNILKLMEKKQNILLTRSKIIKNLEDRNFSVVQNGQYFVPCFLAKQY